MMTLCIRYTLDANKLADFEAYAQSLRKPLERCGGSYVDYFLPSYEEARHCVQTSGADTPQAVLPEPDVTLLHRRQVGVHLREPGIGLAGRHRAILRRAVDFVLPVLEVAPSVRRVAHDGTDHTTLSVPGATPDAPRPAGPCPAPAGGARPANLR